jgi:DNA-directed RNA polymerase specialized sigma24 family protein
MSTTLVDLYTRYSARLAAHVADALGTTGIDTDDVTQEVWLLAAQLLVLPSRDEAWLVLEGMANRTLVRYTEAEYREVEVPSGTLADAPSLDPAPEAAPDSAPTPIEVRFRAERGGSATWSSADIESFENILECADPVIARAVRTGVVVFGRHADGDEVVVDLCTVAELEAGRARTAVHAAALAS